jgi:hypothetical protein
MAPIGFVHALKAIPVAHERSRILPDPPPRTTGKSTAVSAALYRERKSITINQNENLLTTVST